jgi:hypothetical protein
MIARVTGSIAASSGASVRYDAFSNSVYHPFNGTTPLPAILSGGGATTQPAGFSGLLTSSGPYKSFRVFGSAIRAEMLTSNAGDNLMYVVVPTEGAPIVNHANITLASEAMGAETRMSGFGQGGRSVIENSVSTHTAFGCARSAVLCEDDFLGNYNANPSNIAGWEIWYGTCDGSTNSGTITYSVAIAFDVLLEHPTWSSASTEELKTTKIEEDYASVDSRSTDSKTPDEVVFSSSCATSARKPGVKPKSK